MANKGFFSNQASRVHLMSVNAPFATLCGLYEDHPDLPDLGELQTVDRARISCKRCQAEINNCRSTDVRLSTDED